eukprot:GABV01000240.1.p1 GENE.GABV01000240.1~~GABV01000240.1.p1  ORF type:complete len:331 (-),score=103.31 GABV01000240.1:159-1151(-)
MRFRQKCHLARHLGTHNQRPLRPFACRVCSRRFRQASNCRAHEQRHLRAESRVNRNLDRSQRNAIEAIREDYAEDHAGPAPVAVVEDRVDPNVLEMLNAPPVKEMTLDGIKLEDLNDFVQTKWQKSWKKSFPQAQMASPAPTPAPPAFPEPTVMSSSDLQPLALEPPQPPAVSPVRRVAAIQSPPPTPPKNPAGLVPATSKPGEKPSEDAQTDEHSTSWLDLLTLSCLEDAFESEIDSACSSPSSSSSSSSITFSSLESTNAQPTTEPSELSFLALSASDLLAGMVSMPSDLHVTTTGGEMMLDSTGDLPPQQQTAHMLSAVERWMAGSL